MAAHSSMDFSLVLKCSSGEAGSSYGAEIPVKSLMIPCLAFLYRPFGSLCSATSNGTSTNTSMNLRPASLCSSLALSLSVRYGEMKDVIDMVHESANNLDTSLILLMFSLRSASENPRSLFKPNLILSPSSLYADNPFCKSNCSRAHAMVLLPDALRPVSQTVHPSCFLNAFRSS